MSHWGATQDIYGMDGLGVNVIMVAPKKERKVDFYRRLYMEVDSITTYSNLVTGHSVQEIFPLDHSRGSYIKGGAWTMFQEESK